MSESCPRSGKCSVGTALDTELLAPAWLMARDIRLDRNLIRFAYRIVSNRMFQYFQL